ncbi:MAG: NDP-sugar synthase [Candidatus Bathyarchaeota archaeon]|nr:NDP-sugar synthase [Candidatus Bathyarchaeota archaeon]
MLAGGFGTRLRPLSCTRPKTLFPVVNKPLLQWIFKRLAENNIKEAILAVNGLTAFHIRKQRVQKHGLKIKYSIDPPKNPLGTGGPIKNAEKLMGHSETFLVLNGDIFAELSYTEILEAHEKNKAIATIALCEVEDPTRYGVAEVAEKGRIKRFIEKPAKGTAPTNLINAGIYVLSPEIFSYIPKGKHVSMEREIFPKLVEEGKLYGHVFQGLWMDIGKPEEYLQANKILLNTLVRTQKTKIKGKIELKRPIAMDKNVKIGTNSIIGPYAILGKNVSIGKNVQINNSVILPDVKIDDSASINGAIIGEDAKIGKNVKIGKGCIIGDQAKIRDNISLADKTTVCPAKEVSENILEPKIIC